MKQFLLIALLILYSFVIKAQTDRVPTPNSTTTLGARLTNATDTLSRHMYLTYGGNLSDRVPRWQEMLSIFGVYLPLTSTSPKVVTNSVNANTTTGLKVMTFTSNINLTGNNTHNQYGIFFNTNVTTNGFTAPAYSGGFGPGIWSFQGSISVGGFAALGSLRIQNDSLNRAIEHKMPWVDTANHPLGNYSTHGNLNLVDTNRIVGDTHSLKANNVYVDGITSASAIGGVGYDLNKKLVAITGLPPSGTAGGDLSGVYPIPTVNQINGISKNYYDPTSSIQTQLNGKQPTLVSGTNIKTINSTTLLGSGNLVLPTLSGNNHFTGTDTIDNLSVTNTANIHTADVNSLIVESPDIELNNYNITGAIPAGDIVFPYVNHGVTNAVNMMRLDTIANYIFGHNETYDIIICIGQSNMQGKGNYLQSPASIPGNFYYLNGAIHLATNPIYGYLASSAYKGDMLTSFANTWYQLQNRHVILINLAVSSTALIHTNDTGAGHWDNYGTSLTTTSIAKVNTMLDSLKNQLKIKIGRKITLFDQGEQDGYPTYLGTTTANAYRDTLISVFKRFRAAIDPAMHCYIIRTGPWNNSPDPDYYITVRNAQESVPAKDSLSYVIARDAVEFPALGFMSPSAPTVHYNQNGYNLLGRKAAVEISGNLNKTAYSLGDMIVWDGARMGRNSKLQFDSVYKAIHLGSLPTLASMDTISLTSVGKNAAAVIEHFGPGGSNSGRLFFFNSRGTDQSHASPIQSGDYLGGFLDYGNYGTGAAAYNSSASIGIRGVATESFTSSANGGGLVTTVIPNGTNTPVTASNVYPAGGTYFGNLTMNAVAIQTHLYSRNFGADSASSVFDGGTVPAAMWRNNTYYNYNRFNLNMNTNVDATLDATIALKINTTNNAPITLGSGQLAFKSTVTAGVLHSAATTGNISTGQVQSADIASGAVSLTKIANQPANTMPGNNTGSSAAVSALTVAQINTMLARTHTIFTPTTGSTVTSNNNQVNIINPAGTLATLTIKFPASPANNDVVEYKFTQVVTALTWDGNGSSVGDSIGSSAVGTYYKYTFDSGSGAWY